MHPAMVSWSNVMSERDKEEDRFLAGFDHVVLNLFSVGAVSYTHLRAHET